MRRIRLLPFLAAGVLVAAVALLNASVLWEAYGGGPPYYGRTTNMDKWQSPLPWLIPVNLGTVLVAAILSRLAFRRGEGRPTDAPDR